MGILQIPSIARLFPTPYKCFWKDTLGLVWVVRGDREAEKWPSILPELRQTGLLVTFNRIHQFNHNLKLIQTENLKEKLSFRFVFAPRRIFTCYLSFTKRFISLLLWYLLFKFFGFFHIQYKFRFRLSNLVSSAEKFPNLPQPFLSFHSFLSPMQLLGKSWHSLDASDDWTLVWFQLQLQFHQFKR